MRTRVPLWAVFVAVVVSLPGALAEARQQATAATGAGQVVVQPASAPAPAGPEKVGLARLVGDWPEWLTLTIQERGRVESLRPAASGGAEYDAYYLNRFRITAGVRLADWLRATAQGQDSRVANYETAPIVPTSILHAIDLRLANVNIGRKTSQGVSAVVGRQEIIYGDGRLISSPDWGNVGRTYDALRVSAYRPGLKIDVFGAAPIDMTRSFSRGKIGERVYGAWATFDRVRPLGYVDGYGILKYNSTATGELGARGHAYTYTTGVRAGGPITRALAWEADNAYQFGRFGGDSISAYGTHEAVVWSLVKTEWKPKTTLEYNHATGDTAPKDGTRGTFDQLYASPHAKWGVSDLVGWKNMHHAALKLELSPSSKLKITTAINHFWLATVKDGWYGSSGVRLVLNRTATSRDLGWEPDLYGSWALTRDLTVGAGFGVLLGGSYVRQSTDVTSLWTPYLTFTFTF